MTPEERAALLRKNLALPAYEDELIAIYIRAAEDEALDRVAAMIDDGDPGSLDHDWAHRIRALKHAEPTS